ncbi:MAG: hypothetical protein MR593_03015 [Intestinibacter sp.]|uniref:hypothetical protein n=1 Tax=Intestinibacter sp. TaxID=1965304 RepID=UPI0025BA58C0|nr:hypothetical protein [Intestinibacter sp.]MCI6737075.1 hypothetical protein [Intestinibacter sp.]
MYAQALGALLGLIACLYGYVHGDMLLIGKSPLETTNALELICGYTLYPLCLSIFLLSIILHLLKYQQNMQSLQKINKIFTHTTVVIGLLGCKYYFIIPGLLILYNFYMPVLFEDDYKSREEKLKNQSEVQNLLNKNLSKHTIVKLLGISYEELEKIEKNTL